MSFTFIILFFACQSRNAIDNIDQVPRVSEMDQPYAGVFKILDGTWKGQFHIYEDSKRLPADEIDLKKLSFAALKKEGIQLQSSIEVQQIYTSETSYFQRVVITDTYPETGNQEVSKGVNKVQNGKMWCVVKKPSETIIHQGSTEGTNTIIWQSDTKEKKEYFYETVTKDHYEIIGWGYYGEKEDRSLSPKLWFYGKYQRFKE